MRSLDRFDLDRPPNLRYPKTVEAMVVACQEQIDTQGADDEVYVIPGPEWMKELCERLLAVEKAQA